MTDHETDPNEFKLYRERVDRCEAIAFRHPMQAEHIARVLQADDYSLSSDAAGWEFHMDIRIMDRATGQMITTRVDRGDYIVRTFPYPRGEVEIVKAKDFRLAWEEDT